jgi:hypothetical protein
MTTARLDRDERRWHALGRRTPTDENRCRAAGRAAAARTPASTGAKAASIPSGRSVCRRAGWRRPRASGTRPGGRPTGPQTGKLRRPLTDAVGAARTAVTIWGGFFGRSAAPRPPAPLRQRPATGRVDRRPRSLTLAPRSRWGAVGRPSWFLSASPCRDRHGLPLRPPPRPPLEPSPQRASVARPLASHASPRSPPRPSGVLPPPLAQQSVR